MNCKEFEKNISLFIDGKLDTEIKSAFNAHLKTCSACEVKLENTRKMIAGLQDLEKIKAPKDLRDNIMRQLKAEEVSKVEKQASDSIQKNRSSRVLPIKKFALAAALILVVASTVILNYDFFQGPMDEGTMIMESADRDFSEDAVMRDTEESAEDFESEEESFGDEEAEVTDGGEEMVNLEQYEEDTFGIKYGEWIVLLLGIGVISVIIVLQKNRNT